MHRWLPFFFVTLICSQFNIFLDHLLYGYCQNLYCLGNPCLWLVSTDAPCHSSEECRVFRSGSEERRVLRTREGFIGKQLRALVVVTLP